MLPKRGEIWLVNLDPTVGAEIQKTRPAIVISSDYIGKLPLKLMVPITDWKDSFALDRLSHQNRSKSIEVIGEIRSIGSSQQWQRSS